MQQNIQIYTIDQLKKHDQYLKSKQIQILNINDWQDYNNSQTFSNYLNTIKEDKLRQDLEKQSQILKQFGFQTVKFAGKGSFGSVLIGKDINEQRFAFKFIYCLTNQGDEDIKMIQNISIEIQVMKNINHQNVIKFFHEFYKDGYTIIQMEECKGTLGQLIKQEGYLNIPSFIKYGREIVEGVNLVHQNNYIIRDLKPDNILIDKMNVAKVSDFGLAAVTLQNASYVVNPVVGAAGFLAPELLTEINEDFVRKLKNEDESLTMQSKQSDIFSIGQIFYICLGSSFQDLSTNISKGREGIQKLKGIQQHQGNLDESLLKDIQDLLIQLCASDPRQRLDMKILINKMNNFTDKQISDLIILPEPIIEFSNKNYIMIIKSKPIDVQSINIKEKYQENKLSSELIELQKSNQNYITLHDQTQEKFQTQLKEYFIRYDLNNYIKIQKIKFLEAHNIFEEQSFTIINQDFDEMNLTYSQNLIDKLGKYLKKHLFIEENVKNYDLKLVNLWYDYFSQLNKDEVPILILNLQNRILSDFQQDLDMIQQQ